LEENIGRARIRNRLADEARHEWLLFMDADAEVISDDFIDQYLKHTDTDADVVCGGLCHADTLPSPEMSLRYAYEKRADKKRAAHYRAKKPYEQFTPFNFMIRRTTFQSIRFDESIKEYGHEDTLFGIELQRRQVSILHINNTLRHTGIENNKVFLEKTRASLRNLATMGNTMQGHSALLKLYDLLSKMRLNGIVYRWFRRRESSITRHLLSTKPRLCLFFLYKLGYFVKLKSERA
jgi:glycosyltransferase involved in cell wall biosynthesis